MTLYTVHGHDNDSIAFHEHPRLTKNQRLHQSVLPDFSGRLLAGLQRCEACGELLNKWEQPPATLRITKRKNDFGVTYDGIKCVSIRFKSVYESVQLEGLVFRPLPNDKDFYQTLATRIVEFDAERRKTRFIKQCSVCDCFESVVGATPVYLKHGAACGDKEFVRTDLEFASNDEMSPLLLCGAEAAQILKTAKLKGLDLSHLDADAVAKL